MCCNIEIEAADQTCHLIQSHNYIDTGKSPINTGPVMPGRVDSKVLVCKSMVWLDTGKSTQVSRSRGGRLTQTQRQCGTGRIGFKLIVGMLWAVQVTLERAADLPTLLPLQCGMSRPSMWNLGCQCGIIKSPESNKGLTNFWGRGVGVGGVKINVLPYTI